MPTASPMVTLLPIVVGRLLFLGLCLATWMITLSWILVFSPTFMLCTSPAACKGMVRGRAQCCKELVQQFTCRLHDWVESTIISTGQTIRSRKGQSESSEFDNNQVVFQAAHYGHQPFEQLLCCCQLHQLTLQTAGAVLPSRQSASPLSTAPYHTEALFPIVTSPITEALGATNVCSPSVGRLPAKA